MSDASLRVFAWEGSLLVGPAGPQWPEPEEFDDEDGDADGGADVERG